jgi:peptidoglycan/LPS O-acetylase OafA/YrhL
MMHTWSSAVEEQSYLIFLLLFVAKSLRNTKSVLISIAIAIYVLSFFMLHIDSELQALVLSFCFHFAHGS